MLLPAATGRAGILLVIVAGGVAAQASAPGYRPDSAPPARVTFDRAVEVPLIPQPGRSTAPMIDVMVNGHGPYHFLIETGARVIGVSRAMADSIGLPRLASPDSDPEFHVDSITFAGAVFADMPADALPFNFPGIDGVLGLPFYQNLLLTIDYANHRAGFSRDSLPAANGRDVLALFRVGDFWELPVTIAGQPFVAVLDTQNSGSIGIPPSVAAAVPFDGGLRAVGRARGAFGTVDVEGGRLAGNVVIGQFVFPAPFLIVMPALSGYPNRPNVGTQVLDNFVVSLDQQHGRLRLTRSGGDTIALPEPGATRRPADH